MYWKRALVFVCVYIKDICRHQIFVLAEPAQSLTLSPVPWLGVLIYEPGGNATKLVTGVILVRDKVAVSNAETIVKLITISSTNIWNQTNVMFLKPNNTEWYATIKETRIHPEFNEETLVSIAVLFLQYDSELYLGDMLYWPSKLSGIPYISDEIFTVAYTERDFKLKQIVYRMKYVNLYSCLEFYSKEELDSRWLRPMKYHCYNVRLSKQPCVFDPGSALIYQNDGKWFLLGISTWGPGCVLPARFIDFEPYVPWIAEQITTRKAFLYQTTWWKQEKAPPVRDLDTFILKQVSKNSLVLVKESDVENVRGDCNSPENKERTKLVYRDRMILEITRDKIPPVLGVYGVSLYDLRYDTAYTCVQIFSWCDDKAASVFWTSDSFEQDHDLVSLIREQPINVYQLEGQTKEPQVYYLTETWEKYKTAIIGTDITHLYFKFRFKKKGVFEVFFYSKRRTTTSTTTTTTTTTKTTAPTTSAGNTTTEYRTRKSYRTSTKFPQENKPAPPAPPGGGKRKTTTTKRKRTKPTKNKDPYYVPPKKYYWWNKWWYFNTDNSYNWWETSTTEEITTETTTPEEEE